MTQHFPFSTISPHIGELTISNPTRRNAMSADMWKSLPDVLKNIEAQAGLKVLIVRGDGAHFCSGADISEFESLYATRESAEAISDDIAEGFDALAQFPLPVIANIKGACVGGGMGLALCADIRMCDTRAFFAITPANLGLVYPFGDTKRLIETVGMANARDLLLSARRVNADNAMQMGLVNQVSPSEGLDQDVLDYAEKIAALSGASSRMTKQIFQAYSDGQRSDNETTRNIFVDGFSGEDFKEGYAAFLDKRKPDFK